MTTGQDEYKSLLKKKVKKTNFCVSRGTKIELQNQLKSSLNGAKHANRRDGIF